MKQRRKIENKRKQKRRGNPGWKKGGPSPNPGGRPALPDDVRQWLKGNRERLTVRALVNLEKWIESDDNKAGPAAIRIWLSKVLPDAAIAVELTGRDGEPLEVDYTKLTTEQLQELRAILAGAAAHTTH